MKNALFIQKTDEVMSDKMVSILNKYSYTLTDTLTFETFNQFAEQDLDKVDLVAIQDANYLDELPELYFGHKTVVNYPGLKARASAGC